MISDLNLPWLESKSIEPQASCNISKLIGTSAADQWRSRVVPSAGTGKSFAVFLASMIKNGGVAPIQIVPCMARGKSESTALCTRDGDGDGCGCTLKGHWCTE